MQIKIERLDTGDMILLEGRNAQTLLHLHKVGPFGATCGEFSSLGWARRTSSYVYRLRHDYGLSIPKEWEAHGDALVARYFLETPVRILPFGKPMTGGNHE